MDRLKKSIIIMLILCLILLIIILVNNHNVIEELPEELIEETPEKLIAIESNGYNEYKYQNISDDKKVVYIFNDFKERQLYNINDAYNFLDKEYKELRFGTLENFEKYLNERINEIRNAYVYSYSIEKNDNCNIYTIIDQFDNYYIFNETAVLQYSVILDTYTVDLPEFIEKYNSATEQQKVALNIEKFMQSINNKDYKYAYNCLADSFKNNYFKTQAEFESYVKENFYESNTVEYEKFDIQGDVYTYSVILTDKETGAQKNKTFIMQLKEGTEFVLSFDR